LILPHSLSKKIFFSFDTKFFNKQYVNIPCASLQERLPLPQQSSPGFSSFSRGFQELGSAQQWAQFYKVEIT